MATAKRKIQSETYNNESVIKGNKSRPSVQKQNGLPVFCFKAASFQQFVAACFHQPVNTVMKLPPQQSCTCQANRPSRY